ncbi:MAG: hypothetical protein ACREMY_34125 [bacterium]
MEDAGRSLRRYADSLESNPEALASIEARLALLASIKRKYGPTIEEAIARRDELGVEIDTLDNAQSAIEELNAELQSVEGEMSALARTLSETRKKLARQLCTSIERELKDLGMERCRFEVNFEALQEANSSGIDRIEFVISPNPGQPLMPLGKIASGGELSRIMLAIKTIFASSDNVATVIFDEIDSGLSGRVLQSMRDKLAQLARSHQILCITHQPIIASVADNHIEVRKEQLKNSTRVTVAVLGADERLRSIASMASGQDDEQSALSFAQSLIAQANQVKHG